MLVLLVEDSPLEGLLQEHVLKTHGYDVQWVKDLQSAITRLHSIVPDIVAIDMILPDGIGTSLLPVIYSDPRLKNVKIIVTSGHERMVQGPHMQGVHKILVKSLDLVQLVKAIQEIIVSPSIG